MALREGVRCLAESGAKLDQADNSGATPTHIAANKAALQLPLGQMPTDGARRRAERWCCVGTFCAAMIVMHKAGYGSLTKRFAGADVRARPC